MVGPAPLGTLGVKRLIADLPVTDGSGTRWVGLARCCPVPLTAVWLPCQCLERDGELLVGQGQSTKCQLPVWVGAGGWLSTILLSSGPSERQILKLILNHKS